MKKLLMAAVLVAAAIGSAYAGPKGDVVNELQKQEDEAHKRENKDLDKAYSETIKRTGKAAKPYDPWGSVRSGDGGANKK